MLAGKSVIGSFRHRKLGDSMSKRRPANGLRTGSIGEQIDPEVFLENLTILEEGDPIDSRDIQWLSMIFLDPKTPEIIKRRIGAFLDDRPTLSDPMEATRPTGTT